jgi:tetratricopeptide (TPR) repeat protein
MTGCTNSRKHWWTRLTLCAAGVMACALCAPVAAGQSAPPVLQNPAKEPPAEEEIEFNPLKAEKNLEVGQYYLKKGNYDAAIYRLKDALKYKTNFAAPHRWLGEAYEKKNRPEEAVKHYKRYLEILPSAEDAKKVQKRIEKLEERLAKKARVAS